MVEDSVSYKFLLLILIISGFVSYGQTNYTPDTQQRMQSQKAYNLLRQKKYKEAALSYDTLFTLSKGQGTISDNYNSACAFAMIGDKEKAFLHLRNAVFINKWTNINLIMSDPDLNLVHSDDRWPELIHQVERNIEVQAQQPVFNTPYYELENHWVAFPKNAQTGKYPFGFVYIDDFAGFTFHLEGSFGINASGHVYMDPGDRLPITNVTIVRLVRNTRPLYAIPDSMLESLGLPKEPSWMANYRRDMSTVAAKVSWGKHYNNVGAVKKALEYLESAYQSDPHASGLEYELTYAYNELKEYDKAIAVLNAAVKNKPDNEMFYRELGYAYMSKRDLNGAMQSYLKGIEICGEHNFGAKAEMAWNLAVIYRTLKNDEEFKKWGENAKAWAPKDSALYKTLMNATFDKP